MGNHGKSPTEMLLPVAGKIIRWRWKNGTTQIYWENHQMEVEKWDCLQMGSHGKFI
jgi:hypothetical protein